MNWTKEQQDAIYKKDSNILVAAAAGSGKTAVLVERIIQKILKDKIDIDKLLVVTFTNAAASEMRERVLDAIYKKLDENPENINLQRQITLLNMASICTIDSFCLEVVRNNFYQLENVSPNFRIADTAEIELLKQEVLDELFETKYLNDENENYGIAMAASFILFFAVYLYGNTVAVSVSSEKTSRVMETLVTSTTPRNIIIGKTFAMGIVGLGQMFLLILTAFASYKLFIPAEMDIVSTMMGNINFSVTSIVICIVYFILGYTVYAFLNAVTGATISKVEDLNSAQTPIAMISLISFYLAYFTATVPDSSASKFASIFPFSSAFSMPGRILAGGATGWEIALSIGLLIITALLLAVVSIKVYSGAVLHYGKRLNIKDLLKLSKEK